jgi:hypothetical protein
MTQVECTWRNCQFDSDEEGSLLMVVERVHVDGRRWVMVHRICPTCAAQDEDGTAPQDAIVHGSGQDLPDGWLSETLELETARVRDTS